MAMKPVVAMEVWIKMSVVIRVLVAIEQRFSISVLRTLRVPQKVPNTSARTSEISKCTFESLFTFIGYTNNKLTQQLSVFVLFTFMYYRHMILATYVYFLRMSLEFFV